MLTGQNDYDVDMEAMRIGASDYLVKGRIDPADLERSIRYAIAHGRLQEQIRESSALISLGTMAAGMAHEINNPLTVVVGYSELLLQEDIPEAYKQRIQVISSEAQRAGKIITNLMRFAKKSDITK
jgi:signal transduction histidine kinase